MRLSEVEKMSGLRMKYFVLKPHGVSPYAYAAREAMAHYADCICRDDPELANDLCEWVRIEEEISKGLRNEQ